ncbi:MAG: hypothetical protein J7K46_06845 [Bacteroidales bacterium]|nr:hypothetical protein [Bacteroidales bacterium]
MITIRLYTIIFLITVFSYYGCSENNARQPKDQAPNIILMRADDMGWGDPGDITDYSPPWENGFDVCFSTLDYYPIVLDILGFTMPDQPEPIDGISMLPFIKGYMKARQVPIGFESKKQVAFMKNRYKIYSPDQGQHYELYDIP